MPYKLRGFGGSAPKIIDNNSFKKFMRVGTWQTVGPLVQPSPWESMGRHVHP